MGDIDNYKMVIKNGVPMVQIQNNSLGLVAQNTEQYTKIPNDFMKPQSRRFNSIKKVNASVTSSHSKTAMENYYNTKTSHPNSANGTFYTEISAAHEILASEKKNSKTVYKKKKNGVFDPETNIKDNEIKAMF